MIRIALFGAALLLIVMIAPQANAGISASATYTSILDKDGVDFDYSIKLTNTSTAGETIGTFWFAWIPGQDYMNVAPTSMSNPANWTSIVTHATGSTTDGFAIQWKALSSASFMNVGDSLTFNFVSQVTPAQLAGPSPFFGGPPEATFVIYAGAPFVNPNATLVAAAVPEPSSLVLSLIAGTGFVSYKKFRRKSR